LRNFSNFSISDWLKLAPLRFALTEIRNDALLNVYSRRTPENLTDSRTGKTHFVRIVDHRWLHFRGAGYRREVQEQLDMYERMANTLADTGAETTSF
jgi:hypothetical protein